MDTCAVTFEELVDFQEGRLQDAAPLSAHVASGCGRCAEHLEWLRLFLPALSSAMASPELSPSPRAAAFVRGLARAGAGDPQPVPPALIVARLVFDSRSTALPGIRRGAGESFLRVYETEEFVLNLWERQEGELFYLIGQAYSRADGSGIAPGSVNGSREDGWSRTATLQESEFHFESLPAGVYDLRLALWEHEVQLREVQVGS